MPGQDITKDVNLAMFAGAMNIVNSGNGINSEIRIGLYE
jgi:hypothetical protein